MQVKCHFILGESVQNITVEYPVKMNSTTITITSILKNDITAFQFVQLLTFKSAQAANLAG